MSSDFLETLRLHLGGAGEPANFEFDLEGCFLHFRYEDPALEAVTVDYYEGRPAADQAALGQLLSGTPPAPLCLRVMRDFLERRAGVVSCSPPVSFGNNRGEPNWAEPRPVDYYMLCDDEELGYDAAGNPDGDLRTRRLCESWRLVCFATATDCFVEFGGHRAGCAETERVAEGWLVSRPADETDGAGSRQLYAIEDGEFAPAAGADAKTAAYLRLLADRLQRPEGAERTPLQLHVVGGRSGAP